jgi:hypothetical protein
MKMFCDFEVIEISHCPMGNGIIEMEESAPGMLLRSIFRQILRQLVIEIGQNFSDKTHD